MSNDLRFVYALIVAINTNFHLKRRAVSNNARDPGLMSGQRILRVRVEVCRLRRSMAHANTKFNCGYTTTGVSLALCACHGMILPNGVGDLQKGERYCNMDFISMSVLSLFSKRGLTVLSYNIACQWEQFIRGHIVHRNFLMHLCIELLTTNNLRFVIPKYHFWGHKGKDHSRYLLNLVRGIGHTDSEEVERNWWWHNATVASTHEMGSGSWHDTFEDHFQWSNFEKFVGMGRTLARKLKCALRGYAFHDRLWKQFSEDIPTADMKRWVGEVAAWETNMSRDDPYHLEPSGLTKTQIKAQLAEEEDTEAVKGNTSLHKVTSSSMVVELLGIEDLQHRFLLKYPIVTKETCSLVLNIVDRWAVIRRCLQATHEIQAVYMPSVLKLVASDAQHSGSSMPSSMPASELAARNTRITIGDVNGNPEHQRLFLPSKLADEDLEACVAGLAPIEDCLREGQMRSALDSLHVQLHVRSRLIAFKARNSQGQRENLRLIQKIEACEAKIKVLVAKYRRAHVAKVALVGPGLWKDEWPLLKDRDVCGLSEMEPQVDGDDEPLSRHRQNTEGSHVLSWIWLNICWQQTLGPSGTPRMTEALCVEWLRARSRVMRFKEEILYLHEEHR
ncbi:uncharacterized protein PHACADRAFT_33683 [Phanerochaete carnosa HHB-10118-sp]|uniref:CxC2-like cysteine cluster KDZ transposase-associated domain-containing protein n=1 Tax=Phanerochaete carnosa (strain HHB-10118-sp) TaxID=650164 RepID=K5VQW1_PHACS|nr:uncharacterized protein PHACADRAFT_33683 [Phanerochaete carnosa HHB-10118-sp]EKM48959.1 hypothetical protein PHACADRAFT_33683 [Phanerochaete carnosa HHB-10118-sp]